MSARYPWATTARTTLVAVAFGAGLALGARPFGHDAAQQPWLSAPLAHAGPTTETCCVPAKVVIHTNATAGDEHGPFIGWRPVGGQVVPVDFRVIYRRIGQVGSQTVSMAGRLNADGTMSFTPRAGFRAVAPCEGPAFLAGDIVTLEDGSNYQITDGSCTTGGRSYIRADSPCMTDTDWALELARRLNGPPDTGSMVGSSWEFHGVAASIHASADDPALFLQTSPSAPRDCSAATDMTMVSNSERVTYQTLPGPGEIECGFALSLCLYAAFQ